ncbi:MAG: hypothetical protein HQM09_15240 [Candidatus Riflebacteria bacterium]|nr:hypothetical protein [Candidatus Riflebacteria bacterium]
MKIRSAFLFLILVMLMTAVQAQAWKTPPSPTQGGHPAISGVVASGTGTATQYLDIVPIRCDENGNLYTSLSGTSAVRFASDSIGLVLGVASGFSALLNTVSATGYVAVSSSPISLPAATATNIVSYIPASATHAFEVRVFGDEVIFCNQAGLATGVYPVGTSVASGSLFHWDGDARAGNIWAASRNGGAASFTIWGW